VFDPVYVPVNMIVVPSKCAVPVACAAHPDDIMLLIGMSTVNSMSSSSTVPDSEPGIRPGIPEKFRDPFTVEPVCVSCHVIVPTPACPIMLPGPSELLESDALPTHVPLTDTGVAGADGDAGDPPHAVARPASTAIAIPYFMTRSSRPATPGTRRTDTLSLPDS